MRQPRKIGHLQNYLFQTEEGEIGRLKELYFDDKSWNVRYLVVQTGRWLFGRDILLIPSVIETIDDQHNTVQVNLTRKQIENAPKPDDKKPVSQHYLQEYYRYYNWQPYWADDPLMQPIPPIPPEPQPDHPQTPEHPHLRSSKEVTGYQLETENGTIGQVDDFIIDDQDWVLRYFEVDTRRWRPGGHVLISPAWISEIDWFRQLVLVSLPPELIESAPAYDSSRVISRDYQLSLYKHYGKIFEE